MMERTIPIDLYLVVTLLILALQWWLGLSGQIPAESDDVQDI
jgi:hypothetical protein